MKRGLFIFFIGIFIFSVIGSVSAECANDPHDQMFRIYADGGEHSGENTHAAVYNIDLNKYPNYYPICYSDFFGLKYNGEHSNDVHTCRTIDGHQNRILWLSSEANAHVNEPNTKNGYAVEACYGDLKCRVTDNKDELCNANEKGGVIFLYQKTNSHVSYRGNGLYALCCSSKYATQQKQQKLHWEDKDRKTITKAIVGQEVWAISKNDKGKTMTFEIKKKDDGKVVKSGKGVNRGNDLGFKWVAEAGTYVFSVGNDEGPALSVTMGVLGNCGNGVVDDGEECDNGGSNGQVCIPPNGYGVCNYCTRECKKATAGCGDGIVQNATTGFPHHYENCDWKDKNSKTCTILTDKKSCTYCDDRTCTLHTISSGDAYWADLSGRKIGVAFPNTRVQMVVKNYVQSKNPIFSIFDKDKNKDTLITSGISGSFSNNKAVGFWNIPSIDTLAQKTTGKWNDYSDLKDFFFRESNSKKKSAMLEISKLKINEPIKIINVEPECGKEIKADKSGNKMITIKFTVVDPDNEVKGNVSIDGAKKYEINRVGDHSLAITLGVGVHKIEIYAQDSVGKDKYLVVSNIVVYGDGQDEEYAVACIKEPSNLVNIYSPNGFVKFDASTSKYVEYKLGKKQGNNNNLDKLNFYWEFSDGKLSPFTDGSDAISYDFYKYFASAGENWAKLKVKKD